MSILGAVHFVTINKALLLLPPVCTHHTHTRTHPPTCMHTHTHSVSLSESSSHLRAALPHCYRLPDLKRFLSLNFFSLLLHPTSAACGVPGPPMAGCVHPQMRKVWVGSVFSPAQYGR